MKKAAIVYRSRTGTTRRLAEEIGAFLEGLGIEPRVVSVGECDPQTLLDVDFLLLGCWTDGLMVIGQHPDQPWVQFAARLPAMSAPRVGLFTTYKLATGGMFSQMRRHLAGKVSSIELELKSRNDHLSDDNKRALERFVGAP